MPVRDLHNDIKAIQLFPPIVSSTSDDAIVSAIIDTAGFDSCELVVTWGAISDANVTMVVLVEDGDNSALSDNAAVADANLLGLEASTITTGVSAGDGAAVGFADDNKTSKIGYKGLKRYVRMTVTLTSNGTAYYMAGVAILGHPRTAITNQKA